MRDISQQNRRIMAMINSQVLERDGSSGYGNRGPEYRRLANRANNVNRTTVRYTNNIWNAAKKEGGLVSDKKYSRNVYMGIANNAG